jgi:hypothetical protein
MRRFPLLTAMVLTLAACQSVPKDYVQFHAGLDSTTVARHLADMVGMCWFDGKHKAFESYSYAPEPGLSSTRILIVPKAGPHGLPALVVEVLKAKRGTDVRLFGPLMQTGDANTIRTDIMRWTGGAREC